MNKVVYEKERKWNYATVHLEFIIEMLRTQGEREAIEGGLSMTEERLQAFVAAWARHDVEALMTFLTEDCVYEASVGPEPGTTYVGREAVRQGFENMLARGAGGASRSGPLFICGNKGVMEWTFVWTARDGHVVEQRGCDIYEFDGDYIRRKNAFRKIWQ